MPRPTSIRLEDALAERLDRLATAVNRPKTWLIEEAVRRYVEEQSWQVEAIQQELQNHRSGIGDLVPHDEVMQQLEARIRAKLVP